VRAPEAIGQRDSEAVVARSVMKQPAVECGHVRGAVPAEACETKAVETDLVSALVSFGFRDDAPPQNGEAVPRAVIAQFDKETSVFARRRTEARLRGVVRVFVVVEAIQRVEK
jgi:hypothetical protein